jgi:hypothetical protein
VKQLFDAGRLFIERQRARITSRRRVFVTFYRENRWLDSQSRSGVGSRLEETRNVRAALPGLMADLKVRTLLDVPCGDLNWMKHVELGAVDYIGADIVPELVAENERRFAGTRSPGGTRYSFRQLDLVTEPVPRADLVLCRDCLVHISHRNVAKALRNIIASGSDFLLTTTFVERTENTDIIIGWYPINLQLPPFSWPAPIMLIDEGSSEQADKRLGLWDLRALR